ncbi:hypothetical protein KUCAC02_017298 [Chaenocephalus aceratus]|uniref:Uncharacterized protein n=1 Tax=Chaenocephalus aceratus TaxID=36190 RepID=A0ACB9W257_CHAAC|nr:hypothetical protein KUCAC02_017298 [Chaenocephalus aceratus]
MESLRVLELYSGIGGMHYALKESGIHAEVVAAIDINTTANEIYTHNYPDTPLWNKTIEGITLEDFNKLSFDMILMSPPCQPFTRIGLQGDINDPRTKSFLYILDLLPRLCRLPRYILLENVKGFETSRCQEVMVSPTSVGIPNSRLRYFLIAKISTENLSIQSSRILDAFPHPAEQPKVLSPSADTCQPEEEVQEGHVLYKLETKTDAQRKMRPEHDLSLRLIQDFLEPQIDMELYLLPPKTLLRYALLLDIVRPTCRRSVCFTKGYGRYVEGTGSVMQGCVETEMESVFTGLDQCAEDEKLQRLLKLKTSYFTPREVANLMGFPQTFTFPKKTTTKQRYRVLGNSLNVVVVARLLQGLLS